MNHLLYNRTIEPFKFSVRPIHCSLGLRNGLKVLLPLTAFRMNPIIHHKHAQHIELRILRSLIVKQVVIFLKQFFEFRVVVAASSC